MIRIATRRSPLARWQALWVAEQLTNAGQEIELVLLTSEGDVNRQTIDGTQAVGLFTKRIQQAVLTSEADIAVHSLKDLPTQLDTGLDLVAVPPRANVADCLITPSGCSFDDLPAGSRIGTGSRRRAAQLLHKRSDLLIETIRGNVETRLAKIEDEFDAVILAQAGLERLGLLTEKMRPLPLDWMLPAPGQGALGIETRPDDEETQTILRRVLNHAPTHAAVAAERAVLRTLKAGCLAPVAAFGEVRDDQLCLRATVLSVDGTKRLMAEATAEIRAISDNSVIDNTTHEWDASCLNAYRLADELGIQVAEDLLSQGAGPLVEAAH